VAVAVVLLLLVVVVVVLLLLFVVVVVVLLLRLRRLRRLRLVAVRSGRGAHLRPKTSVRSVSLSSCRPAISICAPLSRMSRGPTPALPFQCNTTGSRVSSRMNSSRCIPCSFSRRSSRFSRFAARFSCLKRRFIASSLSSSSMSELTGRPDPSSELMFTCTRSFSAFSAIACASSCFTSLPIETAASSFLSSGDAEPAGGWPLESVWTSVAQIASPCSSSGTAPASSRNGSTASCTSSVLPPSPTTPASVSSTYSATPASSSSAKEASPSAERSASPAVGGIGAARSEELAGRRSDEDTYVCMPLVLCGFRKRGGKCCTKRMFWVPRAGKTRSRAISVRILMLKRLPSRNAVKGIGGTSCGCAVQVQP
jgi:hypothetical protein